MLKKYILCALISMVPLIELRAGVPIAVGMGLEYIPALIVCVIANMIPVPIIYFFARKVLHWGQDKKYIGKFFTYCIEKGEAGGRKLTAAAGKGVSNRGIAARIALARRPRAASAFVYRATAGATGFAVFGGIPRTAAAADGRANHWSGVRRRGVEASAGNVNAPLHVAAIVAR